LKKIIKLLAVGLILGLLLSACESLPFELPWLSPATPTVTLLPGEENSTATPENTPTPDVTPGPVTNLVLWVPPEMDPEIKTEASRLFMNRLQLFSDLNNGIEIDVRVKAPSGPGGLLDALTATSAAAPEALPDVIALSRTDLETAALKNLIFPLEGLTEIPDDTDWYAFTREMSLLQGGTFGLPFAADSLALVYRPTALGEFPGSWSALLEEGVPLAFPADSDQALFSLALYLAEGGLIQDTQRRPTLEVDPLTDVFRLIADGHESGAFAENLIQYQTTGQVWTAFRDGQTDLAITWISYFLKEGPADAALAPFYPISEGAVSLGTGMAWAVATPQENRQALAVDLAEFLVQPDFLAEWSMAAGYLPPRPSSLEGWQNQSLRSTLSQVALMTQLRPSNDILTTIGPIMREGVRQILQGAVDPAQAAQVAVESLEAQ
jgi:ABC-type glycerol-3-phosphate transport system substrate-binding protein